MTREESIKVLLQHSEHWKRLLTENICSKEDGSQTVEALDMAIKALEQESCDDYIKVPKNVLKYRTARMVAYNTEWLKNHFDIERAVICGAQEQKTGNWIDADVDDARCSCCNHVNHLYGVFCKYCGAKMVLPPESEE